MSTQIQQFDALISQMTTFVSPALTIKVSDNTTANDAVETGKQIKEYQKKIEALRKELVGPFNEQVKEINDYAKKISAPLNDVEAHLKIELSTFAAIQEKKRAEEMRKIEAAREVERLKIEAERKEALEKMQAEAKETGKEIQPLETLVLNAKKESEFRDVNKYLRAQEKAIEATAMKGVKRNWKAEVLDETKIPREFLSVDMKKINEAVRLGVREIAGVKISQETSIAFGKTTKVTEAALVEDYFGEGA